MFENILQAYLKMFEIISKVTITLSYYKINSNKDFDFVG